MDTKDIFSMSHMDMIAIELFEMHQSLIRAGFAEKQATEMISFAVASGVMLPVRYDSPETVKEDIDPDQDQDPNEGFDLL
jgi:hypothetical protein